MELRIQKNDGPPMNRARHREGSPLGTMIFFEKDTVLLAEIASVVRIGLPVAISC